MSSLKLRLSQNGFTSSESYDHAVQCFINNPTSHVRWLHVDGDCGRRRTAFANALAHALQAENSEQKTQVLYYEFGKDKPVPQIVRIIEGEEIVEESPVEALDRILTEACALSEAEPTVLVLDQLHKTQFLNHIRLYEFLQSGVWKYSDVQYQANLNNLSLYLISNEPLYHSLQSASFRLWVNESGRQAINISAADLGLNEQTCNWLRPLQSLLKQLKYFPTLEEYRRLSFDIEHYVHNKQQLKTSLFGWLENMTFSQLDDKTIQPYLKEVLEAIVQGKGIDEEIEISSD